MNGLKDIYQDIPPVTLRLAEDVVTSHLYCSSAEGIEARVSSLVEAFLVEVYRCRVCQFTSSIKASICTHVAEAHNLSPLACLVKDDEESSDVGLEVEESEDINQNAHYDLDGELHSKDGEDHMDHIGLERMSFLLPMYGILQNMSPQSCDMGLTSNSEGSLQVEETCEVTTLFADDGDAGDSEADTVFQLRDDSADLPNALSCRLDSDIDDEAMAQSAHLMTLGLCRISSNRVQQQPSVPDQKPPTGTQGPGDFLNDKKNSLSVSETLEQTEEDVGISCILCQVVVSNRSLLDVHLKCHNGPHEFRCPRCGVDTQEWVDMERHWRGHSQRRSTRPHKCTSCHKVFQCEEARRAHEQKHKRRKRAQTQPRTVLLKCTSCQEWCQSASEFELHKRCHCTGGGFECPHCNFIEKSWEKLHRHIRTKHKNLEKKKKNGLERHNHLNENSQKPKMLESDTWYLPAKKRTKQKTVGKEREGQTNGHPQKQTINLKKKTGGRKEFCCTLCDRKFSTKMTMRRHMGIHQGDKPFECPHCDYCTRLKASLEQHLRVHTGEKPFKCTQCSYASIDRSSLRRHLRTHTQEKPYCCQYCSYSSIQKKSLDLHLRRHHTGESFPCHLCKYTTPDRQLLVRHIRKYHSSENSSLLNKKTCIRPVRSQNVTMPTN